MKLRPFEFDDIPDLRAGLNHTQLGGGANFSWISGGIYFAIGFLTMVSWFTNPCIGLNDSPSGEMNAREN